MLTSENLNLGAPRPALAYLRGLATLQDVGILEDRIRAEWFEVQISEVLGPVPDGRGYLPHRTDDCGNLAHLVLS